MSLPMIFCNHLLLRVSVIVLGCCVYAWLSLSMTSPLMGKPSNRPNHAIELMRQHSGKVPSSYSGSPPVARLSRQQTEIDCMVMVTLLRIYGESSASEGKFSIFATSDVSTDGIGSWFAITLLLGSMLPGISAPKHQAK